MPNDNKTTGLQSESTSSATAAKVSTDTPPVSGNLTNQTVANPNPTPPAGMPATPASFLSPDPDTVVTSPQLPKKYGGKKIIATIFGVFILIVGVAVAVFLVQRQQEIQQRASSGAECSHSPDCVLLESPGNSGTYAAPRSITYLFITAREAFKFDPQNTDNGCYRVSIDGPNLTWQRYGDGPSCKDISNIQVWLGGFQPTLTPTTAPQVTASCGLVKAYSSNWNPLSQSDLQGMKPGQIVRFAVSGTTSSGSFDKAKFIINGTEKETSTVRPGTDEFYIEYTIPTGTTSFTVNAQVHHATLGWF